MKKIVEALFDAIFPKLLGLLQRCFRGHGPSVWFVVGHFGRTYSFWRKNIPAPPAPESLPDRPIFKFSSETKNYISDSKIYHFQLFNLLINPNAEYLSIKKLKLLKFSPKKICHKMELLFFLFSRNCAILSSKNSHNYIEFK